MSILFFFTSSLIKTFNNMKNFFLSIIFIIKTFFHKLQNWVKYQSPGWIFIIPNGISVFLLLTKFILKINISLSLALAPSFLAILGGLVLILGIAMTE